MKLGLIGNCQYNALVNPSGNIDWMCWPRFDSSFLFGGLLDREKGGKFSIGLADDSEGKQEYIVNTNILRTVFEDQHGSFEVIDFAPRFYQYDRFFKPTMLVRMINPLHGQPRILARCKPVYEYGAKTFQSFLGSNHIQFDLDKLSVRLTTDLSITAIAEERPIAITKRHFMVLTWEKPFEVPLQQTCEDFYHRTTSYWQRWVKRCHLPGNFKRQVIRSALVLKLHQFEDTGAIIAASTTSIPEAMGTTRNWDYRYCWIRDAYFTISALLKISHFDELEGFERYIRNILLNSDGKDLQPLYTISGDAEIPESELDYLSGYLGHKPVRIGNAAYFQQQNDLFGQIALAVAPLFLDPRFEDPSSRPPFPIVENILARLEKNVELADAGLWEFRGIRQLHTFTLLMHWNGARAIARIAEQLDRPDIASKAKEIQQHCQELIEKKCWDHEAEAFVESVSSKEIDASSLMLINFGFLSSRDPRAKQQILAVQKRLRLSNDLIKRYSRLDDFGSTENAFIVCNFWLAEAYGRVGMRAEGVALFEKLVSYSNHLGILSEDVDPANGELWGNFPQTYSHVGLINAAFSLYPQEL